MSKHYDSPDAIAKVQSRVANAQAAVRSHMGELIDQYILNDEVLTEATKVALSESIGVLRAAEKNLTALNVMLTTIQNKLVTGGS